MPGPKRVRRERTEEWASIKQWTLWPEQELYEQIRPIVLYQETAGERAKEIDVQERTLARKAAAFERYGMASLFPSGEQGGERETSKTLPPEIRQLIVDLHAEAPSMSWREIAEICYIRYGRKPNHHSIKRIATSGLPPSLKARRYQPWHLIPDPADRNPLPQPPASVMADLRNRVAHGTNKRPGARPQGSCNSDSLRWAQIGL